ncbi:MAG: hypothetical protein M9930_08500 [Anaerolineae bacterium]|nr:hypothetical protein [Anaerolineae bacterium]
MITQDDLQALIAFDATPYLVYSAYVDTDMRHETLDAVKLRIRSMLKENDGMPSRDQESIEHYLDLEFDWTKPGVAIFTCAARDYFDAFPVNVSFRNRLRVGPRPYVKPLAHYLDYYAHYGVILVDKLGARFFEFHLGELQRYDSALGEDVRKLKRGSGSTATGMRGGNPGARHEHEVVNRNLREMAQISADFFADSRIRRLFIGGSAETVAQFQEYLPKKLLSCIAGTFAIDMTANDSEVRDLTLELLKESNNEREHRLVEQMVTTAAKGGAATAGLEETLKAVREGRVDTLIVSDGYRAPGYFHSESGFVTSSLAFSPYPSDAIDSVDDIVDVAVTRTVEQGGQLEVISNHPDLEDVERIGAILRY